MSDRCASHLSYIIWSRVNITNHIPDSSPVDEPLYRDPTDDIIGDVMSQSYNKNHAALRSRVSTIQTVVLTADVFQLF